VCWPADGIVRDLAVEWKKGRLCLLLVEWDVLADLAGGLDSELCWLTFQVEAGGGLAAFAPVCTMAYDFTELSIKLLTRRMLPESSYTSHSLSCDFSEPVSRLLACQWYRGN
jgi:hypothetical protein